VNRENIIMVPFATSMGNHYTAFKKDVRSLATVQQVGIAHYPMYKGYDLLGVKPEGEEQFLALPALSVDENFISMLGLKWKIPPQHPAWSLKEKTVIVNETAAEKLNLGNEPIGEKIDNKYEVSGVLKDFHYQSLQSEIGPLCIFVSKDSDTLSAWSKAGGCLFARLAPGTHLSAAIQQLKRIYNKYDLLKPFEYYFMDETYDAQYKAEDRLLNIMRAFTGLTILIACLGLFGLATFMAFQRTKEIGIRKVLGASVEGIVHLLAKDFIKLVIISIVVAAPVGWWLMNKWLQNFTYRVDMGWWVFAIAGILAIVIAMATVGLHAVKAALANPVKSLRSE
jgi:putative ABC transport system permease protein